MKRLVRFVDQLQLAGKYLHEEGTQFARLSLVLADNVVELLVHERCQQHLIKDEFWGVMFERRLSKSDREAARGQSFKDKINLLVRLGDIPEDVCEFAKRAHEIRNQCYHEAVKLESVWWRVAWSYHELACKMFKHLRAPGIIWGPAFSPSNETQTLLRAAGIESAGDFGGDTDAVDRLTNLIRGVKPQPITTLQEVLTNAAQSRIRNLLEQLEFIAHDGLDTESLEDALFESCFGATVDVSKISSEFDMDSSDGIKEFIKALDRERFNYSPPVTLKRVYGWQRRAKALKGENSESHCMKKFMDLLRESEVIYAYVDEASTTLDQKIQAEIDSYRGK